MYTDQVNHYAVQQEMQYVAHESLHNLVCCPLIFPKLCTPCIMQCFNRFLGHIVIYLVSNLITDPCTISSRFTMHPTQAFTAYLLDEVYQAVHWAIHYVAHHLVHNTLESHVP